MQEPHDHRTSDIGEEVQLSVNMMCMLKSPCDNFSYEWLTPSDRKIKKTDKRYKDSNTDTLKIKCFEYKYRGTYTCVLSTMHEPRISISAKVGIDIQSE